ncbi:hypothetical protein DFJ73DRAFT_772612 [Zopfochytrium polystomum]|nr:hypothetical protein DFJ73DRAFT_772612 [Zopfochytrium polystomum]
MLMRTPCTTLAFLVLLALVAFTASNTDAAPMFGLGGGSGGGSSGSGGGSGGGLRAKIGGYLDKMNSAHRKNP